MTAKAAVTVRSVFIVTVQVPVPGHVAAGLPETVQPVKVELPPGAAVSVIVVPLFTVSEQSGPQLMPEPVIVPLPVLLIESVR